jgi:CRP/FNR family cyclic AMP-dependent transcriptional regulator
MQIRSTFDEREMAALRTAGTTRTYQAGETLFREGDRSDHVVVIVTGKVKISSISEDGYEAVLAVRSGGDIVGEFSALDGRPRSASVHAIDTVAGVLVSGERFRLFLADHPTAAVALLGRVVGRLRESDRRRAEFGPHKVTERVARLLLELAESYGSPAVNGAGTAITVPFSQSELAGATGASREAVARSLRQLRERGAVRTERRKITVLRPDILRQFGAAPAVPHPRAGDRPEL